MRVRVRVRVRVSERERERGERERERGVIIAVPCQLNFTCTVCTYTCLK